MILQEFYEQAIQFGIDADPRGRTTVEKELSETRKAYDELKPEEKEVFDTERLKNPYADSRILHGSPDRNVNKILIGIDMEAPEMLLADRLNQKGAGIDLVLAHHPEGRAYANFYEVMKMQADILNRFGVPINVAENQLSSRMKEVERSLLPVNHSRPVDAARLLDIPYLCLHTPADNMVSSYLQERFDRESPSRLKDVVKLLKDIPEYREAIRNNAGPRILIGSDDQRTGKIFVDMTGGTSGSKETIERLSQSGVGTIVGMHMSEDHRKEAEKHHLHVVIAGHISSDSLGLNLLLDAIEKRSPLQVIECSGFRRVKRQT
ncbi:MAG TPA: NGG1p interacting factor NIF3 [Nitrospirota bacterium]|nr:NGG1p interacting factor NIF3 [Nitrospirota bacterium]